MRERFHFGKGASNGIGLVPIFPPAKPKVDNRGNADGRDKGFECPCPHRYQTDAHAKRHPLHPLCARRSQVINHRANADYEDHFKWIGEGSGDVSDWCGKK